MKDVLSSLPGSVQSSVRKALESMPIPAETITRAKGKLNNEVFPSIVQAKDRLVNESTAMLSKGKDKIQQDVVPSIQRAKDTFVQETVPRVSSKVKSFAEESIASIQARVPSDYAHVFGYAYWMDQIKRLREFCVTTYHRLESAIRNSQIGDLGRKLMEDVKKRMPK
mmetsp:Transcript_6827/g.10336  ORF Transcript_6827/g.10336 Transcript_6827/m.10336 type:complete len:167 (-) Transcript_6827:57-557(-)